MSKGRKSGRSSAVQVSGHRHGVAVYPGSFDPLTVGHLDIIERGAALFRNVVVAIGKSSLKKSLFSVGERMHMARAACKHLPNVTVVTYEGLTVAFAQKHGANFLLRGLRDEGDFRAEAQLASANRNLSGGLETVFLVSSPEHAHLSSTIVRDILMNGGDISAFVPQAVASVWKRR